MSDTKTPLNGKIMFAFDKDEFTKLSKESIPAITIGAILSFPDDPHKSDKELKICIQEVRTPGGIGNVSGLFDSISKAITGPITKGLTSARNYLVDEVIIKKSWTAFGYTDDHEKRPIAIVYVPELNFGAYCLKRDNETLPEFKSWLN